MIYYGDKKKKSLMVTLDDWNSEKSSSSDDEQANICLMAYIDDKVEVNMILFLCLIRWWRGYALSCSSSKLSYDFSLV